MAKIRGEIDHEYTTNVVCPWCGHEFSDCFEWPDSDDGDDCTECGKRYSYYREVSISYVSKKEVDNG